MNICFILRVAQHSEYVFKLVAFAYSAVNICVAGVDYIKQMNVEFFQIFFHAADEIHYCFNHRNSIVYIVVPLSVFRRDAGKVIFCIIQEPIYPRKAILAHCVNVLEECVNRSKSRLVYIKAEALKRFFRRKNNLVSGILESFFASYGADCRCFDKWPEFFFYDLVCRIFFVPGDSFAGFDLLLNAPQRKPASNNGRRCPDQRARELKPIAAFKLSRADCGPEGAPNCNQYYSGSYHNARNQDSITHAFAPRKLTLAVEWSGRQ